MNGLGSAVAEQVAESGMAILLGNLGSEKGSDV